MTAAKRARRDTLPADRAGADTLPRTEGELAVRLMDRARAAGRVGVLYVAGSEGRAERLVHLLWRLSGDVDAFPFPAWDCLPFDRVSPSPRVMGLRIAAMAALAGKPERPFVLVTTADALIQRLPPPDLWARSTRAVRVGDAIDPQAFADALAAIGYRHDERVDETGEVALRGGVVDVFPAGYGLPVRIDHAEGSVVGISSYDAATQRSTDAFETLRLRPVSEAVLTEQEDAEHRPGIEHRLPELYPALATLLDYAPDAPMVMEPLSRERGEAALAAVRDAYESRLAFEKAEARPLAPERLYLRPEEYEAALAGRDVTVLEAEDGSERAVPLFALDRNPGRTAAAFAAEQADAGRRIVAAGPAPADLAEVARVLGRALGQKAVPAEGWDAVRDAKPGTLLTIGLPVREGFVDGDAAVIAAADLLGSRASEGAEEAGDAVHHPFGDAEEAFRIGDAVIHLEHGIGVLEGIETVAAAGTEPQDTIRLGYAGGSTLMVPVPDIALMWRYGAAGKGVTLDKLDGTSWPKRRAKVESEIRDAASALAAEAAERRAAPAAKLVPPASAYERFVARFPFNETPDQRSAVADILHDLSSGHPMERLVCGDVGFGKTEVALRAAAAAVLAGKQVAVVAPTTVLVRQHLGTFRSRFGALGIPVAHLSRLVAPAEARDTKAALADGSARLVVGTHALAGKDVRFADLGLLIVDEEQRFGAADKEKLRRLGSGVHVLTLTATPIPRTLQAALAGLQQVSVLTTPPARRQPVRTSVRPLDDATLREALIREKRRGGQSFVVCPRIEDIEPMAERLRRVAPELALAVAHGKLPAAAIDETMVAFAGGTGDVLLATNIIESGLDVPRANTILVWRADRFGLSQLHQLRGRVGRGAARGAAYFLTDPDAPVPPATLKRLETLASLDRLGAGFQVSAEDLDQRGAGDLVGDKQAGHVKLIGSGLYRRLLERALVEARGEEPPEEWVPDLRIGLAGQIPEDYVPEPETRINLHARLARSRDPARERRLVDELTDRFGPVPEPVRNLIALSRLRRLCREAGVARVDGGPQAIALTFKTAGPDDPRLAELVAGWDELAWKERRLVLRRETADAERPEVVEALLERVARS